MCLYFYYTFNKSYLQANNKNKYIFKNGKILSAGLYFMEIYARIKDNKLNY
ncbi:MAG: hypothetical protein ACLRQF_04620 [Thomasclavelia ramosa]